MLEGHGGKYELDLDETEELLNCARRKCGEDPDTRCQLIAEFRDMIYERGECIPHRMDDAFLLRFLRAREFIVPRAHRLLVNYYDFKENNPEMFNGVKLTDTYKVGDRNIFCAPPYKDQHGQKMIIFKLGNWDPDEITEIELFQTAFLGIELGLLEPQVQILGVVIIVDFKNIKRKQIWHITPSMARKLVKLVVSCVPVKITALHVVNQSKIFDSIYRLFKPLLIDGMKEKLFLHGENMESLHQHIDPKHLPNVYGGIHEKYDYREWMKHCRSTEVLVKELQSSNYIVDDDPVKS